jgi:hypothetical protein
MAKYVFNLPDVGEGVFEGEIVKWNVKPGDTVKEDEPLVELMTDKATVSIPSSVNGKVVSTTGKPGDMVPVGAELIVFEVKGASGSKPKSKPKPEPVASAPVLEPEPKPEPVAAPPVSVPAPVASTGTKPLASPAVRRRAREAGIDLSQVSGTAGEAKGLVPVEATGAGTDTGGAATGSGLGSGSRTGADATGSGLGFDFGLEPLAPLTSKTINSAPTGTISPGFPVVDTTLPLTLEGMETVALSVINSTRGSSSLTVSPGLTFHFTISPSNTPSPTSGRLNTYFAILAPQPLLHRLYNPFLTREIFPL